MHSLKITSFNVEWMTHLFQRQKAAFWVGPSQSTGLGSKPKNVQRVCERIAGVIQEINPDILGIQEGPPLKTQMQLFNRKYLNNAYTVYSMPDGSQSIHTLVRKGIQGLQISQVNKTHKIYEHLNRKLEYYLWGDVIAPRKDNFTRNPVVLKIKHRDSGDTIELMNLHTKSKFSELKNPSQWEKRDEKAIKDALRARQKLSAEMMAVRRYLTYAILSNRVKGCIVMGDLNDGINREIFEKQFLLQNIVDELRGSFKRQNALMNHALSQSYLQNKKLAYTSEFQDATDKNKKVNELLDHILFTYECFRERGSAFSINTTNSKVEHEAYRKQLDNNGKNRDDRPGDHIPISMVVEYA